MILIDGEKLDSFKFSGGEIHLKTGYKPIVTAYLRNSDDIIELLLFANAMKQRGNLIKQLEIPYIPYARQDRVCNEGEPFSIKVMADLINSIEAKEVIGWDVHSDVTTALINNFRNIEQYEFVPILENITVCSPDGGALKKAFKVSQSQSLPLITANKIRDTKTGDIVKTEVNQEVKGDILIVDDICDGGRTFIELAKVLKEKGAGKIYLYVTHGIFSKGIDVFDGLIDKIYATNSFCTIKHKKLTIIKER